MKNNENNITITSDERWKICLHEAGHVVIAKARCTNLHKPGVRAGNPYYHTVICRDACIIPGPPPGTQPVIPAITQ